MSEVVNVDGSKQARGPAQPPSARLRMIFSRTGPDEASLERGGGLMTQARRAICSEIETTAPQGHGRVMDQEGSVHRGLAPSGSPGRRCILDDSTAVATRLSIIKCVLKVAGIVETPMNGREMVLIRSGDESDQPDHHHSDRDQKLFRQVNTAIHVMVMLLS